MVLKPQTPNPNNPGMKPGSAVGSPAAKDAKTAVQVKPAKPKFEAFGKLLVKFKSTKIFKYVLKINDFLKERFCSEQEVIGIEIQPDTIRFCYAKQENDNWKIIKIGAANVLNTYQQESLKKNKMVYSKALRDLLDKYHIANTSVAISIPAALAIIKTVSLPYMPKENLDKATKIPSFWQNLVQISDNLADYSIFYKIIKENSATKEMDVLFIAAKKEELKTYIEIAKEAGLEPCVIDVGCFSINNVSKLKSESVNDLQAFLKIGRDENYLQILEQGKPYIYDLFVSDNEKTMLNESLENQTFQQRFVSQLNHIISKHQDKQKVKIDKISVISSEANIDKFLAAIGPKMEDIKLSIIDLLANIELPEELIEDEEFKKTKSSYAVCTGLSTRNLNIFADESKKNVSETTNLLPGGAEIISALKSKFYSKLILWAVTILCTAYILFDSISSVISFSFDTEEIAKFNSAVTNYNDKKAFLDDINSKNATLNKLLKIKDSLPSNQDEFIEALNEISGYIPQGVWIEQITFDKDGKFTIAGKSFEEKGIISFSKSFDYSKVFAEVSINSLKSSVLGNGTVVKEFLISGKFKSTVEKAAAVAGAAKDAENAAKQPNK